MNTNPFSVCQYFFAIVLLANAGFSQEAKQQKPPVQAGPHIVASSVRPASASGASSNRYGLTRDDHEAILTSLPNLRLAVPTRQMQREARFADKVSDAKLIGTVAEYAELHALKILRGRFLTQIDVRTLRSVVVISNEMADELFANRDPIGQRLRTDKEYFIVVGVFDSKRTDDTKQDDTKQDDTKQDDTKQDDTKQDTKLRVAKQNVYIPITTMRARFGDNDLQRKAGSFQLDQFELSTIELLIDDATKTAESVKLVEKILERQHEDQTFKVTIPLDSNDRGDKR